jgi:hypothetical protein
LKQYCERKKDACSHTWLVRHALSTHAPGRMDPPSRASNTRAPPDAVSVSFSPGAPANARVRNWSRGTAEAIAGRNRALRAGACRIGFAATFQTKAWPGPKLLRTCPRFLGLLALLPPPDKTPPFPSPAASVSRSAGLRNTAARYVPVRQSAQAVHVWAVFFFCFLALFAKDFHK